MVNGKQLIVFWYINNLKNLHIDANVVTLLISQFDRKCSVEASGIDAPLTVR